MKKPNRDYQFDFNWNEIQLLSVMFRLLFQFVTF